MLDVPVPALEEPELELDNADSRLLDSLLCCDELYPPPWW
jgi:hypothetical protein